LANDINELGIQAIASARPYTHLCSSEELLYYADCLPIDGTPESVDVEALLALDESQTLEVKGSATLDLTRWLSTDERRPTKNEDVLNDGVIKAVVGMLNADGGTVILGAVESNRMYGKLAAAAHPKLAPYLQIGKYVCVGIDHEPEFQRNEWDGFRLWLQNILGSRIDPAPAGALGVTPHRVGDQTLCIIRIQPSRATWYYRLLGHDQPVKFYVREDGRTMAYAGSQADIYKRSRPRG
jgi:predicted HTH transcriptional regulator